MDPSKTEVEAPAPKSGPLQDLAPFGDRITTAGASQARLVWMRFRRHRLALISLFVLAFIYFVAIFGGFLAPMTQDQYQAKYSYAPPQMLHISGSGLYVHGYHSKVNPDTLQRDFSTDSSSRIPVGFFVHGQKYKILGLFTSDIHFIGPKDKGAPFYLLGSDRQGRDMLSRTIYGARISMSIGLVGVALAFILGIVLGGISGYAGGRTDTVIQRFIEFVMSMPTLPLWLGLSAAVPPTWSPLKTYFAITIILSLIGWTGLARVMRSRFMQIRREDFVLAAEFDGASRSRIIGRHMLPSFASHIIASLTLSIPSMILAETSLSFLGLGLRPPAVSWGVLLQDAQNVRVISSAPWLLFPGLAVVVAVMALNFVGDGLRDAADPYG
ncbi:MAG TPA: ABC transporter permease [Mycobacteriales bacterium]|nr:ABC transporter permease [Mycobacteriales bacterium]